MAIYGSNVFQWRPIVRVIKNNGNIQHIPTVQYRHKDVIIGILGVSIGAWSDWYWENPDDVEYQLTNFTPCDSDGNPL